MKRLGPRLILSIGMLALHGAGLGYAQSPQVGSAQNAIGVLLVIRPDGIQERLQGKGNVQLFEGDLLKTDAASQAMVEFKDGVQIALNENTAFKILSRWEKDKPLTRIIRLRQGELWVKTGDGPKALEVETPVATAAVRETEFNIKVQENGQSILTVIQGIVEFGTAFGTCPIRASTISYGARGKKCTKPAPTEVVPAIAWTKAILQTP
jgi:ferric-dicitrate binding protein FerR (iron transport regulator)